MGTLSCEIKFSIRCSGKIHLSGNQIPDNVVGTADHQIHGMFIILIMSGTHCIFKIVFIIIFPTEHTNTALCQKRI